MVNIFYKKNKKIDTFVSYKKNEESIKKCADMNELSISNNKTFFITKQTLFR